MTLSLAVAFLLSLPSLLRAQQILPIGETVTNLRAAVDNSGNRQRVIAPLRGIVLQRFAAPSGGSEFPETLGMPIDAFRSIQFATVADGLFNRARAIPLANVSQDAIMLRAACERLEALECLHVSVYGQQGDAVCYHSTF